MGQKFQIIAIVLFFLVTGFISVHAAEPGYTVEKRERFVLYPGKKNNPYSIIIPLRLKHYGKIRLSISNLSFSPEKIKFTSIPVNGIFRFALVNPAAVKHQKIPSGYVYKETFVLNPEKTVLEYFIDEPELIRTHGKYDLYISNMTKNTISGEYYLQYPGSIKESRESRDKLKSQQADLAIEKLSLTSSNNLLVSIVNKGKKSLPDAAWSKKNRSYTMLEFILDGKTIGGESMDRMDPGKKLRQPGGKIKYSSNIKINKTSKVKVVVNPGKRIKEADFKNNALLKVLSPHHKTQKLPDLVISKVFLTPQKK